MRKFLLVLILSILSASTAVAEDLNKIFAKVNEYVAAENYSKAIKELEWAKKELEKLNGGKLGKMLPDTLVGFRGGKLERSSALGFNNLERKYSKDKQSFTISITGGSGSAGLGGLAALGQMGALMGSQPGVDTFRLDGKTANLDTNGRNPVLTVFLESGSILKLESRGINDEGKTIKSAAEAIKIGSLDQYLAGK